MAQVHIHDSEIRRSGSDKGPRDFAVFHSPGGGCGPALSQCLSHCRPARHQGLARQPSWRLRRARAVHGHAGHRHVPHLPRIRAVLGALTDRWTDLGAADASSSLTLGIVTGWLKDAIYSQAKMPKIRGFDEHIQRRQSA
jgi:hypothetical protein